MESARADAGSRPPTLHAARGGAAERALPGPTHSASWRCRSPPTGRGPRRRPRRAPAPPDVRARSTSGESPLSFGTAPCGGPRRRGRARAARPAAPPRETRRTRPRRPHREPSARRSATSSVALAPSSLSRAPRCASALRTFGGDGVQSPARQKERREALRPEDVHRPGRRGAERETGNRTAASATRKLCSTAAAQMSGSRALFGGGACRSSRKRN